jgi:hypothetical protein
MLAAVGESPLVSSGEQAILLGSDPFATYGTNPLANLARVLERDTFWKINRSPT